MVGGAAGAGEVLEGEPQWNFTLRRQSTFGLLRAVITPGVFGGTHHPGDNAATDPNSGKVVGSGIICALVDSLIAMASSSTAPTRRHVTPPDLTVTAFASLAGHLGK